MNLSRFIFGGWCLFTLATVASLGVSTLSQGQVTSVINTQLSSSTTTFSRSLRFESALVRSVVILPKRIAFVYRCTVELCWPRIWSIRGGQWQITCGKASGWTVQWRQAASVFEVRLFLAFRGTTLMSLAWWINSESLKRRLRPVQCHVDPLVLIIRQTASYFAIN